LNNALQESIHSISQEHGADLFGVAHIQGFSRYSGKRHPTHYLPDAQSVIVIGIRMYDPLLDVWINAIEGKKEYYLVNEILGGIASDIIQCMESNNQKAILSPYSGVFTKDAGVMAGLGIIGRNNLLITEQYGPRVRLRAIITDAKLDPTTEKSTVSCDGCPNYCWTACPANAFPDGQYHREICTGYSEKNLTWLSDNAFLYCRECELACPYGKT
jgi:epoxyqueuosine reductase